MAEYSGKSIQPPVNEDADDLETKKQRLFALKSYQEVKKYFGKHNYKEPRLGLNNTPDTVVDALEWYGDGGEAERLIESGEVTDGRQLEYTRNSTFVVEATTTMKTKRFTKEEHWVTKDYAEVETPQDKFEKTWPNKDRRIVMKFKRNKKVLVERNAPILKKALASLGEKKNPLPNQTRGRYCCAFCKRPVITNAYKFRNMGKMAHENCVFGQTRRLESEYAATIKSFEVATSGSSSDVSKVSLKVRPVNRPDEDRLTKICEGSRRCSLPNGCRNYYFIGVKHECGVLNADLNECLKQFRGESDDETSESETESDSEKVEDLDADGNATEGGITDTDNNESVKGEDIENEEENENTAQDEDEDDDENEDYESGDESGGSDEGSNEISDDEVFESEAKKKKVKKDVPPTDTCETCGLSATEISCEITRLVHELDSSKKAQVSLKEKCERAENNEKASEAIINSFNDREKRVNEEFDKLRARLTSKVHPQLASYSSSVEKLEKEFDSIDRRSRDIVNNTGRAKEAIVELKKVFGPFAIKTEAKPVIDLSGDEPTKSAAQKKGSTSKAASAPKSTSTPKNVSSSKPTSSTSKKTEPTTATRTPAEKKFGSVRPSIGVASTATSRNRESIEGKGRPQPLQTGKSKTMALIESIKSGNPKKKQKKE